MRDGLHGCADRAGAGGGGGGRGADRGGGEGAAHAAEVACAPWHRRRSHGRRTLPRYPLPPCAARATAHTLCAQLPVLYAAAKIVTFYEVVQGALRYLTALFIALALGIIYLGSIGLVT